MKLIYGEKNMSEENNQEENNAAQVATKKEPGRLSKAFKSVAGVAIPGSLLTSGIGTFMEFGDIWSDISLGEQAVSVLSTVSGHMAVWSVAMTCGALGWALGKYFDGEDATKKPRAIASSIGVALIAASFAMPLNETVSDTVENSLRRVFNMTVIEEPIEPYVAPLEPKDPDAPTPAGMR